MDFGRSGFDQHTKYPNPYGCACAHGETNTFPMSRSTRPRCETIRTSRVLRHPLVHITRCVLMYILDVRTMTHQTYTPETPSFGPLNAQRSNTPFRQDVKKLSALFRDDSYEVTRLFWFRNISSPWKGSRNYERFVQSRMRPKHDVLVLVRCVLAPVGGQSAIIAKTTHTS